MEEIKLESGYFLTKDEVWGAKEITCPYCGYAPGDSWECEDSDDEDFCEECGKYFAYERIVDITYNSIQIEQPGEEDNDGTE